MIEMSRPEDILPPELVAMAKGDEPLPETTSVEFMRAALKKKLHLDPADIAKVNTFSRMDLVKDKMRELTAVCKDQEVIDVFDLLAMDWVYSDRLEWDGSMADIHMKKSFTPTPKTEGI